MRKAAFISKGVKNSRANVRARAQTLGFDPRWESSQPPANSSHSAPPPVRLTSSQRGRARTDGRRVTATGQRSPSRSRTRVIPGAVCKPLRDDSVKEPSEGACLVTFHAAALETTFTDSSGFSLNLSLSFLLPGKNLLMLMSNFFLSYNCAVVALR